MFLILGLGDGWKVARINDSTEYMFINQFHRSDYYNRMRYYVGGRTTSPPLMETIRLNQTFGFSENGIISDQLKFKVNIFTSEVVPLCHSFLKIFFRKHVFQTKLDYCHHIKFTIVSDLS